MPTRVKRAAAIAALALLTLRFWPHAKLADQVNLSTSIWSADGQLMRVTLATDDTYRLWTPLNKISHPLIEAFLLKEDRSFYWHPGVNPIALTRAAFRTLHGPSHQGGSTITKPRRSLGFSAMKAGLAYRDENPAARLASKPKRP